MVPGFGSPGGKGESGGRTTGGIVGSPVRGGGVTPLVRLSRAAVTEASSCSLVRGAGGAPGAGTTGGTIGGTTTGAGFSAAGLSVTVPDGAG